jgi:serine kinase of HPr protein (carbohydrate metabolism regulator)
MELSAAEVEGALKDALITENPCIAVYSGKEETIVRVSVRAQAQEQATSACQSAAKTVLERLGSYVYGVDVPNIVIPVSEGRDLVNLVETAAQQQKLILSGYDPVEALSERLRVRAELAADEKNSKKRGRKNG